MASRMSFSDEDLSCPVCHETFKEPVILSCSHSFCKACLHRWWSKKVTKECPVCKTINLTDPPCNRALKNLCEAFTLQERNPVRGPAGSEVLCSLHVEKFKLFCQECQQPVCLVCRDSKKHTNHRFRPVDEVVLGRKEEVQKSLKPLQEKLNLFLKVKTNHDQTAAHIKLQTQHTEMKMKKQFNTLHQFLQEEEEDRIKALREEEQQKSQMMKEKIDGLNREISSLSNSISAIETELRAEHVSFLQNYTTTMERVQLTVQDPQPVSGGALIDVVKHLKKLTFRVWDKMKDIVSYTPVTLDPNTAHPQLMLSDDLTKVSCGQRQQIPDNPERFDVLPFVLGSEGFNKGSHSWDVEVGDSTDWSVGVLEESYQRKGTPRFRGSFLERAKVLLIWGKREGRRWGIELNKGTYTAVYPSGSREVLSVIRKPQVIRVKLWNGGEGEEGELSFSDRGRHIHTFTIITTTVTDTVFPFFGTDHTVPLMILPGKISDLRPSAGCPMQ